MRYCLRALGICRSNQCSIENEADAKSQVLSSSYNDTRVLLLVTAHDKPDHEKGSIMAPAIGQWLCYLSNVIVNIER